MVLLKDYISLKAIPEHLCFDGAVDSYKNIYCRLQFMTYLWKNMNFILQSLSVEHKIFIRFRDNVYNLTISASKFLVLKRIQEKNEKWFISIDWWLNFLLCFHWIDVQLSIVANSKRCRFQDSGFVIQFSSGKFFNKQKYRLIILFFR